MTDAADHYTPSPSSLSSSSSSSTNERIKIKIKLTKISPTNRRSQRRRTNPLPPMRTSSLTTTILHENGVVDANGDPQTELPSSSTSSDNLVFTTTSKANSKSSYWTVTDREPEWYKLAMPTHLPNSNGTKQFASYRKLPSRRQSASKQIDHIDRPTDTTQLIMKAVMHELDYDIDDDDLKFLHELNQYNKSKQKRLMTEEELENAIIILEFSIAGKIRAQLKQKSCDDDDIVCDICLLPDADDGNEMVFCERCNCCVHQHCYGIPIVPTGTWLCRPCSILRRPACILCPKLGGPMKCSASGTIWCHLTCALWLPELKFVDYVKMEPVLYLDKISHARWSLRCVICSTLEGACVQCAHKNCRTPFHVTCGLAAGYFLDVQQTTAKASATSRSQFNAYCFKHSDEARKRAEQKPCPILSQEDDSSCSSSAPASIPLTVYRRDQLKAGQWLSECYKQFTTLISSSHLHDESPHDYDEVQSRRIYEYWATKRQFNRMMPLIKRIDFVLEQRENAELLIAQINACLKMRQTMRQLQSRCQASLESSTSPATTLPQRLDSLRTAFSASVPSHHRRRCHSSSTSPACDSENDHENAKQSKSCKRRRRRRRHRRQVFYSAKQHQTIEKAKRCRVSLEPIYRHNLQLNTTYLIGTTDEGQTILLPKQLIEQANAITVSDSDALPPVTDHSEMSSDDEEEVKRSWRKTPFTATRIPYTSQGNLVTCVTGSFN